MDNCGIPFYCWPHGTGFTTLAIVKTEDVCEVGMIHALIFPKRMEQIYSQMESAWPPLASLSLWERRDGEILY